MGLVELDSHFELLAHGVVFSDPLLIVSVLLRSKPKFELRFHVVHLVSSFVDPSVELPLAKTCKLGSMALLNRILDSQALLQSSHEDLPWSIRSLMFSQGHYQKIQVALSLLEAAKRRDLEMTTWLFEHFRGFAVPQNVVKEAAAAGASELLEYYLDYDINARSTDEYSDEERDLSRPVAWGGTDAADAIRAGHRNIAAWMYRYVYVDHRDEVGTLKAAVATGDVQMVEMLQEKLDMDCDRGIQEAAANGNLDMVQCMYEQELEEMYDKGVVLAAATNGHLDVVRWLIHLDSSGGRQAPSQLCRQTLKQTGPATRKRKTEQNI